MSSLCFVCELPILSHQSWGIWPLNKVDEDDDDPDGIPEEEEEEENGEKKEHETMQVEVKDVMSGDTYHEDCLHCDNCGMRLTGLNFRHARRFNNKVYCSLHYADIVGLSSGEEFMQKLREFKQHSLGCAEARRKSSTTLQFPVPVQACVDTSSCNQYPHFIKPTPGYWIECSGSASATSPSKITTDRESNFCNSQHDEKDSEPMFELLSFEEEAYEKYFYGSEHWNYFTNDEALGPVIMNIKQENIKSRDQFRIMLRTVSYTLHGLVPASSICADRYDREAVVRALSGEAGLEPSLVLGQLPSIPDELLKLDQVFIKSELKVGVAYVKEGQCTEEQILSNCSNSHKFEEFLAVLGDKVRLKGFDRYKGGLDTVHDLTGSESVYTCWRNIEIMFHVSTLLPHEDNDPQKLQKKRHIGNDIVCVVFLEADDTSFSPVSIKSHFLHTFIVVKTNPKQRTSPTVYEVSVVSRDEVGAYKPYLWHKSIFEKGKMFREWLLTKIVNGERSSYSAPKFARMQDRTRTQMLEDIVTNLQNHAETGQIPKPYRRGSWRPIGHMRPSSPLLDSVRDTFDSYEQLAKDFTKAFQNGRLLCDVVFNVGQGKDKVKVYAVRSILGVRSRVFLEMLYGFTTGFGQIHDSVKVAPTTPSSSSNFLQVPELHAAPPPRNKSAPSSPIMMRAFARLGNWAGWNIGGRSSSKEHLLPDSGELKRWQSEFSCKDKMEKEKNSNLAATTVTLSVCADVHKIDRNKLCQTEFNIVEFDSDTFQGLVDYLHTGSCPLSCETIPGLICAAEHYDLPELLQACFHHTKQHLRISVVCSMLNTLENYYWRYTSASEMVNMILLFIDTRATQLFSREEFYDLSESMFQMIVGRELNVSEVYKFEVMFRWATVKVERRPKSDQRELYCIMNRLTRDLKLYKIPPHELIKVILPTKTIRNERILETLLYQADTGIYRVQPSYLEECRNSGNAPLYANK